MWLLASRGRPDNLKRFIKSYQDTNAVSQVYLRLDECDDHIKEYQDITLPDTFILKIGKRARLGAAMKEIYEVYPHEPWYGLLADDLVPITDRWDSKLINAAENYNISQFNDLSPKPKNYCHPCIGGDLVRKAGFFGFPYTTHYALEIVWKDLVKRDKRFGKYLPDVIIKNIHPEFDSTVKFDKTYKEAAMVRDNDIKIWQEWKKKEFENFYNKIIN